MLKKKLKYKRFSLLCIISMMFLLVLSGCGNKSEQSSGMAHKLGAGWNLGNSLDCVDFKQMSETGKFQYRNDYQVMISYSSDPYTAWDASDAFYIRWEGSTIQWNISSLNSDVSSKTGSFNIQIINHHLKNQVTDSVKFKISDAIFTKKDGREVKLDKCNGEYSVSIKDSKSDTISLALAGNDSLASTEDLLGGSLRLRIQMENFPNIEENTDIENSSTYYETMWNNPVTTKDIIDQVKDAGFKTVRVPVSYYDHLDENGKIDESWLKRVEEVVSYVIDDGMYGIIDLHHDTGNNSWIVADTEHAEENLDRVELLWKQIAEHFKQYNDKLIFEGLNEILDENYDWNCTDSKTLQLVNKLNQKFVDTVRKSGGENKNRILIVNTYGAGTNEKVLKNFELPEDLSSDKILVDVHSYESTKELNQIFEKVKKNLLNRGIMVILGEFGMKHTPDADNTKEQLEYINEFTKLAKENNVSYCWWDAGGKFDDRNQIDDFTLLDRENLTWFFPELSAALTK